MNPARSERNIRIGAVLAVVVVAALAVVALRCISALVSDAQWVDHTEVVLDAIDKLDWQIARQEAAAENYQLSHNRAFLTQYVSSTIDARTSLQDLRTLTIDNARQQVRLQRFEKLFDRDVAISVSPDRTKAVQGDLPAFEEQTLLPLSAILGEMRGEEHQLLAGRRHDEFIGIQRSNGLLLLLAILFAGLLAGTYWIAESALDTRKKAIAESTHLNARLEIANRELEEKRHEAEEANQLKSQFLASMSHELRTPLNAISGFSELLAERLAGPLTEKQERFLKHIREASKHLLQLINDILDLSKIEAGEMRLEMAAHDPEAILEEVIGGASPMARVKSVDLSVSCEPGLLVRADSRRLKQILYNLLSNALKFTPQNGSVQVKVSRQEDSVLFAVADTGPGISEEDQKIIFEEFRQAAAPSNGVKEGTGLGLAITRKLVEKQGGEIGVESKLGEGSVFRFWLPACSQEAAAETTVIVTEGTGAKGGRVAPLILVVDDDEKARELIRSVLESEGYRVATCDSSAAAIQATRELKPALITLDLLMPGGSGFATLFDLKTAHKHKLPPVIIVSVVDDRAAGFALGASDYLLKPVSKSDLLTAVRKHLPGANGGLLVVDDDPAMLELAKEVFARAGMTLHLASSGRQGLEIAKANRIDAIVLDLVMPEMDGLEFLVELRKNRKLASIPVSVLTSKDLSDREMRQLKSTVTSVFRKSEEWRLGLVAQIVQSLGKSGSGGVALE